MDAIKYTSPDKWCHYRVQDIVAELVEAKGSVMSLRAIPFQKRWVEALQEMQLKMEIAGTSRIEGADFAGSELEAALNESPEELLTRSQRQAHAAVTTYRWIAKLPQDKPIDLALIREIHYKIVKGADDDHCPPGDFRAQDQNVIFGVPPHRGVNGGSECLVAVQKLVDSINGTFKAHDPLIQALMAHYYVAAMHPFLDGNGRTARAIEALMLQRSGLRDALFIAMSNYYHDEKQNYLSALSSVIAKGGDLTDYLRFGLKGIALQTTRLATLLRENISKELYRSLMHDLYTRLESPRKRVLGKRHIALSEYLLKNGRTEFIALLQALDSTYKTVANSRKTIVRDINYLRELGALQVTQRKGEERKFDIQALLDWPTRITESEFFEKVRQMPKTTADSFLSAS